MIKGITYSGIFRNMAGFCKLVAQNWHKNLPSCVRVVVLLGECLTVKNVVILLGECLTVKN